ncbi:MAG: hypothetical protein K940chlam9_00818, partial [Chlamydiae bacterium]|nr:hypothetical protein [Chlamydiota bacterium]
IRNADTYQFLQNFLGGGFVSTKARAVENLDQADLVLGKDFLVGCSLWLKPFIGFSFACLERTLDVEFLDFVIPPLAEPIPSILTGSLRSRHWGVGPTIGTDFSFPLCRGLEFTGRLALSALGAKISSSIDSHALREALSQSFEAKGTSYRITPVARTDLGLSYTLPLCHNSLALSVSAGYEVDYYFRFVDRINPDDGYVNNPNTSPKNTTSSLGLGGPYAQIALTTDSLARVKELASSCCSIESCGSFYCTVENSWLRPCPTSGDLDYAVLQRANGTEQVEQADPDMSWSGSFHLGYHFSPNFDLEGSYRTFHNRKRDSVFAREGEGIASLNASGPADVVFSEASSRVDYQLDQFDLSLGRGIELCSTLDLYGFVGLRYSDLKRTLHNAYLGGEPPLLTESKFPTLRSHYWGVGPLMGVQPTYYFSSCFGITGLFDIALLVGNVNSKLDQENFGTVLDETSNTLRTRNLQMIVPVIDTKIGAFWRGQLGKHIEFCIEGGYRFSDYFQSIDLLFPVFLIGLDQDNSSLHLSGPYVSLSIASI